MSPMDSGESAQESPVLTEKGNSETPWKRKACSHEQKSLAEFFEENKKIAGFGDPGKALYNTVRGLVEYSLDSAQSRRRWLPTVEITIEEIDISELNSMIVGRIGEDSSLYRVTCEDCGTGMSETDILELIGGGLDVSKIKHNGRQQTRGISALGVKMAFIWSKMSTGVPIEICTRMKKQHDTSIFSLDIDINGNIGAVELSRKKADGKVMENRGSKIKVVIEGKYGSKIREYIEQLASVTRCADFDFQFAGRTQKSEERYIPRRIPISVPAVALETKYHPFVIDMGLLKDCLAAASADDENVLQFFQREIPAIGEAHATRMIGEVLDISSLTKVKFLTSEQISRMQELFAKMDCRLVPVGEEVIRRCVELQLEPKSVATYTTTSGGQGDPFIVEAAVSLGGNGVVGLNIRRFANRVPLLFQTDADVVTKTAMESIDWKHFRINPKEHKVGVYVSIVSTKIPFSKESAMEFIGDDASVIAPAVKICLEKCCMQLKSHITYCAETTARCMYGSLQILSESDPTFQGSRIKNWENATPEMRQKCPDGLITEEYMREALLRQHFGQVVD